MSQIGVENSDDAKYCIKCGANLEVSTEKSLERRAEEWGEEFGKRAENCFGLPRVGAIAGIIFGAFIIIFGLGMFLGLDVGRWIGSSIMVVIGILIVVGAIYGLSRRRS